MASQGTTTIIGGIIGAIVGSVLPGIGTVLGGGFGFGLSSTGALVGLSLGASLGSGFEEKTPVRTGNISDLRITGASFGDGISRVAGSIVCPGSMIWTSGLYKKHDTKKEGGGLFSSGTEVTTIKWFIDAAWLVCSGPADGTGIEGIPKIWMNGKLVWNTSGDATALDLNANGKLWRSLTIYKGTEGQLPDPVMESYEGVGQVPAHRGYALVVVKRLKVLEFFNKAPNLSFLVANGNTEQAPPNKVGATLTTARQGGYFGKLDEGTILSAKITSSPPVIHTVYRQGFDGTVLQTHAYNIYSGSANERLCKNDPWFALVNSGAGVWSRLFYKGVQVELVNFAGATGPLDTFASEVYDDSTSNNQIHIGKFYIVIPGTEAGLIRYIAGGGGEPSTNWDKAVYFSDIFASHIPGYDYTIWPDQLDESVFWVARTNGGASDPNYLNKFNIDLELVNSWNANTTGIPSGNNFFTVNNFRGGGSFMFKRTSTASFIDLYTFDPDTDDSTWTFEGSVATATATWSGVIPLGDNMVMGLDEIVTLDALVTAGGATLQSVVEGYLDGAGYAGAQYDMSALTGTVEGARLPGPTPARDAIQQLQLAHYFDMVEVDYKITGIMRGGASVATIAAEDMAAAMSDEGLPDKIRREVAAQLELPRSLTLNYLDIDTNYEDGSQIASRQQTQANAETVVSVNEALDKDSALQAAFVLLYNAYAQQQSYTISLLEDLQKLVPGDVITITDGADSVDVRIVEQSQNLSGVLNYTVVPEFAPIYTQAAIGASPLGDFPAGVELNGAGLLAWLDIPMLANSDDNLGVYAGAAGYLSTWRGHDLFKYADAITAYSQIASFADAGALGVAEDVLADWTSGVIDWTNTVTTQLLASSPALVSTTEAEAILDGAVNRAALGAPGRWEVFQFITATALGNNRYTLSGLLRARRGTNYALDEHTATDEFVLLDPDEVIRLAYSSADIDVEIIHKFPSADVPLDEAPEVPLTFTGRTRLPFAPADVRAVQSGSDWVITWEPRSREDGSLVSNVASVDDPEVATYTVDFVNGSGVVQDSYSITVGTETKTWTSAEQTASGFGAPQSDINVIVYQKGITLDTEGHGHKYETATDTHSITDPKA